MIYAQNEINDSDNKQFIKKQGYSLEACYRKATDYLRSNTDQVRAIPYLEYIIETDRNAKPEVLHMLAEAYYYDGKFDKAITTLSEYIDKERNNKLVKSAKHELERYKAARQLSINPLNVSLVNLGPKINSKYSEINPFISKHENLLVFSSNRSKNFNVYVSKKPYLSTHWEKSKLAGNYVNTVSDEFVAGLSPSGKNLMVHYNQVSGFEDINISTRKKGLYRELEDPGSRVNSTYREEGACMTENGDTLYFASDRPGGFGGFDLYYSLKLPDGTFGIPINLGETINTKFDENYPNLSPDGSKLYFASQGHNAIEGFDIFYSSLGPISKTWATPTNIGYPINNAYDNKSITFTEDPRYAYLSTIDGISYGDYDIYKVIFKDIEPNYLIVKAEVYIQDGELKKPYKSVNKELTLTTYKDNNIYGTYTFNKRNNSFVLAFMPGTYIVEINAEGMEAYRKKITIDENYYKNKLRLLKIYLNKKS
jgi:hypothetical protein